MKRKKLIEAVESLSHKVEVMIALMEHQKDSIWKLENPPIYKIGDKVEFQGEKREIVDIHFNNSYEIGLWINRQWVYSIATPSGIETISQTELILDKND